ncbi:MAG: GAF domain-containing protein, partial [Nitrospirae bacterium]|nr:GAF domain-containing protein [Nitrospirota bacterium]
DADTILTKAIKEKRAFNVTDVHAEPLSDPVLIQQLGTLAYAVLPLISRDKVIGVLWVDNIYTSRPITDLDMEFMRGFTDQMASAIENARLFEHVAQAEQELENIFESISDLVYFNSNDYTVKKVNRAVLEKLGKPPEFIIGRKCYEVFHGTAEPWKKCPHHKTITTKEPYIEELEDPHLGGTFLVSSSPIFDKSGELMGTVHIVRDISELKKLREKVATSERMAALGEMAAKVAHEIRNPLLSIGGFARRLEKRLDSELKEYSRIIVDEVSRLEGILNDTLSFVKSSPPKKVMVNITELIDSIINLLEPAALERGNKLTKEIKSPVKIYADYDRFKEVLINLMTNANHATDNGNIIIRTYKTTTLSEPDLLGHVAENREAVIEIEDNGCGIKDEDINRIFDPFFTTRPAGTGLGLSITKRIVEEHGGRIEVESIWGSGTKFKIYIPVQEG